ncbi:MAG: DUF1287 domain-containing protein [Bacillota bacterium]
MKKIKNGVDYRRLKRRWNMLSCLIILLLLGQLQVASCRPENLLNPRREPSPVELIPLEQRNTYDLILLEAREEVRKGVRYDASYQTLSYPGGDVDPGRGACTDVIVRALRGVGYDLQVLIYEDMSDNFHLYPQLWGLEKPDPNIDHRRTQNQIIFLKRFGQELPTAVSDDNKSAWRHGDLVYWLLPDGQQHTGIISDRTNTAGIPLVIHNAGVAREEDCLLRWTIIGHFRFPVAGED